MATGLTTIYANEPIRLDPIAGPDAEPLRIEPGSVGTIGRSMNNDMVLLDGAVSREHASVQDKGGRWLLLDRGSRHGTLLNGVHLEPGEPAVIRGGDLIRISGISLLSGVSRCAGRSRIGEFASSEGSSTIRLLPGPRSDP